MSGYFGRNGRYNQSKRAYYVVPIDERSVSGYEVKVPKTLLGENACAEYLIRVVDGVTGNYIWVEGGYFNTDTDNKDNFELYLGPDYVIEDTCSELKYFVLMLDYDDDNSVESNDTVSVSGLANNPTLD